MEHKVFEYFDAWNSFDAKMLRDTLHNDVTLTDWEISVNGIDAVLEANQSIQREFPKAKIKLIDIGLVGNSKALAQISIHLASENIIDAVDVFEFNDNKIFNIVAYKR